MRILIVEDNPDLVENLFDFFEPRGHVLDAAYDGHAGLKFALAGGHDVIVLDVMLPGLDGTTVCARLRAAGVGVPVLLLTARDTLADKLAGFEAGADDYLLKPFALAELEARLTALTRRARGEHVRSRLEVADLAFEPDTRQVWRGGRPLELPATPLKILELLMRAAPRVVTRAEIEHAVWGEVPPDSDALRAHMHLLRAAVDKPFERPLLRTVRGVGYQLLPPEREGS